MNIKLIMKIAGVSVVVFVAVVGVQLSGSVKSVKQAQEAAITNWAMSNSGGNEAVSRFKAECQSSPAEDPKNRIPIRPVTFEDCAEKIGYPSLSAAINAAEESVFIPAPLRWIMGV